MTERAHVELTRTERYPRERLLRDSIFRRSTWVLARLFGSPTSTEYRFLPMECWHFARVGRAE
jgi:hypothetical protein